MGAIDRIRSGAGVSTEEDSSGVEDLFDGLGAYQWVAWFVILEIGLLVVGLALDMGLGVNLIGGLFAAFAVTMGIGGAAVLVVALLYRAFSNLE